jgi:hypothetical protein
MKRLRLAVSMFLSERALQRRELMGKARERLHFSDLLLG